jgi:hypothetical protein
MAAQGVLALGIILVVSLLILVARRKAGGGDDREDARRFITKQIDAHVEALAQEFLEAGSDQRMSRPGTDRFGQAIELFIGDVLLRRAERAEPWLKEALREILVLERDDVYGEVRKRVEAHLRRPSLVK